MSIDPITLDFIVTLIVSSSLLLTGYALVLALAWTDSDLAQVDEEAKAVFRRLTRWER